MENACSYQILSIKLFKQQTPWERNEGIFDWTKTRPNVIQSRGMTEQPNN